MEAQSVPLPIPSDFPSRFELWVETSLWFNRPSDPFIMLSIQDLGRVERFILEAESSLRVTFPAIQSNTADDAAQERHALLLSDCSALSVFWICGLYEAIRNVRDAEMPQFKPLADLFGQLEIIRMPLAKHEMKSTPGCRGKFHYPQGIFFPSVGWMGWKVFNPVTKNVDIIARTNIANRFLGIARPVSAAHRGS